MTAPVLNALVTRIPGLRVTVSSSHPSWFLESLFDFAFERIDGADEFGLRMVSARQIDLAASAEAYRRLHARLDRTVAAFAERMTHLGVDLVLSNAGYLGLLAAREAGIQAIALSCLNWADIYGHYFRDLPEGPMIEAQMLEGYRSAKMFLCSEPAMPMPRLTNARPIGPLARVASLARDEARRRIGIEPETRLGVVAFGGIEVDLPIADWPRLQGWRWVINGDTDGRPDLIALAELAISFPDLLGCCDVLVAKPGYGTFTEAAVNGAPVLYLPRPDWPEAEGLVSWLDARGRSAPVGAGDLFDAQRLAGHLDRLTRCLAKPRVVPSGVAQAASLMAGCLG